MNKLSFEQIPDKMAEVIENQERIISMLSESPANQKAQYITRKEVKRLLNVSSDVTIIEMEKKGQLKPYRIGRRVLYKISEVESTMQSFER